jgi:HlyD family secretion protein
VLSVVQRSESVLAPGSPLFEIGDPASLEVEVDVLSEDAVHLRPDGLYGIYGRALGDGDRAGEASEVPARLREVSPRGFTKRSSLGVEEQRVHAWLSFVTPPPGLGHGYRVHMRAALEVARGALLVPRRALLRDGRDWIVFVGEGARARRRVVELGLGDESWVVVRSGLTGSEDLCLDVPETLEDGDPVVLEEARDLAPPAPLPGQG